MIRNVGVHFARSTQPERRVARWCFRASLSALAESDPLKALGFERAPVNSRFLAVRLRRSFDDALTRLTPVLNLPWDEFPKGAYRSSSGWSPPK